MVNILYKWSFNSKKQRGSLWYLIVISVSVGLIVWGFLSKQYGMSFVIIILAGLFFYIENNSRDIVEVVISEQGIKVEDIFYPFSSIQKFGIIYDGDNAILLRLILKKKLGIGVLDVDIDNSIVADLKSVLTNFLEENENTELSFGEKLSRILKL